MNLVPVPAIKGGHHRHDTRLNRCDVALPVDRQQIRFAETGIPLINSPMCPTIADKVLGGRHDAVALHSLNHATGEFTDERRVGTIGFIGTAPPGILRYRQSWRKNPVDPRRAHLLGGRLGNRSGQLRISDCAQRNVVGKQSGAYDIVVTVNCVRTPDYGDTGATFGGVNGGEVITVCQIYPVLNRGVLVLRWEGAAPVEHTAEAVASQIVWGNVLDLPLNHLRDFLLQCQCCHDSVDAIRDRHLCECHTHW